MDYEDWISAMVDEVEELVANSSRKPELREARKRAPLAYKDQLDAAERESAEYVRAALTTGDVIDQRMMTAQDNPVWVRRALFEALIVWTANMGAVCVHNPSARAPQPVYAAMWRPRLVVCAHCTPMLTMAGRGLSAQDRTCPGCQRITGGPGSGDELLFRGVQVSMLTFAFPVCAACRY